MRIHSLTFQAIGPYATRQHLDFEQLDAVGLFLLDGPTGAGKSTILDSITFALYGKADDERKNTELYSTLAEPGVPPTIQLDVSFGTRRFMIDRTLQHFAPRRGATDPSDVVTRQAAMSLVEVVAGQHRQLTTRVDEAQQLLRGVIGLTREQFTSVVLLPQGEFARFLKASSSDREEILRQLFNTHRFEDLGNYLTAQAKTMRATVEADTQRRDSLRSGLLDTARALQPETELEPGDEVLDEALDDAELVAAVEQLMHRVETAARTRIEHTTTTLHTARSALRTLQTHQEQLSEAKAYRRRRAAHDEQAEAVAHATQQLEQHRRATPVADAQQHCDAARAELTNAVTALQQHCDTARRDPLITGWAGGASLFTVDEDDHQALATGWKTVEATAIRALEQVEQHEKTHTTISAGQRELTQWHTEEQQLTAQLAELEQQFQTRVAQHAEDTQAAEHLAGSPQTLLTARQRFEDATAQHSAARKAAAAQAEAETAKTVRDDAATAANTALEHAQTLLRRRIETAAAFLAANLQDGQPCEVCGSQTHPHPAQAQDLTDISEDAVQRAERDATTARRKANDADASYQTTLAALHTLQTQAGGHTVPDAATAVAAASNAVTQAEADVDTLTALRARIKAHVTQIEALRAATTTAEQQRTTTRTQIASLTTELDADQTALTETLGDFDSVAALRAAVEPAHRLVGQLVTHCGHVDTAITRHATARQRVDQALANSATPQHQAFADAQTAATYLLDDALHQEYETLVRTWTTERDRLTEKAGQHAVIAGLALLADSVTEPTAQHIATAQQAQHDAETALAEANREHGSIQTTRAQCLIHQDQLTELSARSARQLASYAELLGLSDVVAGRGENAVSMPLRSFVLAGWLEQVAANASERLTGMTGGRYELKHAVGQGGRGHSGLNLEVIDHLNDTVRTPSTLSGGETFMASLALALGLADAVQAQAGGVAMDTLFIDEGFGSLDADTLEEVMGVLAALQDDGRLIGLVSHVESMKQQIPHRIQVQKSQAGSNVRIIGPDLA